MDKNFTSENLIELLYNEAPKHEAAEIRQAMKTNLALGEEYTELREAYEALPKAKFNPSRNAIQNILRYSKEMPVIA